MIHRDEVKKLAELSLLAVGDAELDKLTGEIDAILEYISEIDTFASEGEVVVEKPVLYNVFREDVVTNAKNEYTERILGEAPSRDGDYVRVKKIL